MSEVKSAKETSFFRLAEASAVRRIEIPLIQRDYAQGRPEEKVRRIRDRFLEALQQAVMADGAALKLDFVYGDLVQDALYPLDGQQRLTTLFLLHWYLAWRTGVPIEGQPWTQFTYATRASARMFCERLVKTQPAADEVCGAQGLSRWLRDQAWYFYTWQQDPTIQAMLLMLDALHGRFAAHGQDECLAAWERLIDARHPAVSFYLLPIPAQQLTSDLYIKMNSRGKPLTEFENFKAQFIDLLKSAHPQDQVGDFARKADTAWSDILWCYRGEDQLIDDEFMRYFRCVTEVRAWLDGIGFDAQTRTEDLATRVYGEANPQAAASLAFLFHAFDTWHGKDIQAEFDELMTAACGVSALPLRLFNPFSEVPKGESPVDLFAACCRDYDKSVWTLAHTLLLYAVLLHRSHETADFPRRLRLLRNLIEASRGGEIREDRMPVLLADVERIVVQGHWQETAAFNQAQLNNEIEKTALLGSQPTLETALHRLEDHDLLRGCLAAFDLDPAQAAGTFQQRADAFHALFGNPGCWLELTGSLLALGDYSRQTNRWTGYRFANFGSAKSPDRWRYLFMGKKETSLVDALMALLDRVAAHDNDTSCLASICGEFVQNCEAWPDKALDWRYYFVKYPQMRDGRSGRYAISASGYSACMLEKWQMNSYYRDPYLLAAFQSSGVELDAISNNWPWFYGYETQPRRMVLKASGIQIECVDQGWQLLQIPVDPAQKAAVERVCAHHAIQAYLYSIPQSNGIDSANRVEWGARLLRDLVDAGL